MNPPKPAGVGSSIFVVVGIVLAFVLLVWMVSSSSSSKSSHPDIIDVTAENWEKEVADSTIPVVIDFWAPWCGPCLDLAPTIDRFAKTYKGKVKVVKVNFDEGRLVKK